VIRIERAALPTGMNAFARRQDGTIVVYVSSGLSVLQRRAAIREALRAAPLAGWRALRSPTLLPVLAGSAGLRRAPEGRWISRALLAAAAVVVAVAVSFAAATLLASGAAPHQSGRPPGAARPGELPAVGSGHPAAGSEPSGTAGTTPGSSAGSPGAAPARAAQPRNSAGAGAPAPETSGQPATVPTAAPSPQPSGQATSSAPAPAPVPSPSPSPTASKGGCVDLLGIQVCV
jgi:hypothetical protein